jgi:hypothetical protein
MAIAVTVSNRIQLQYEKGTMNFNKFAPNANAAQLYELAQLLNSVQTDPIKKVLQIREQQIL